MVTVMTVTLSEQKLNLFHSLLPIHNCLFITVVCRLFDKNILSIKTFQAIDVGRIEQSVRESIRVVDCRTGDASIESVGRRERMAPNLY